ncbi:ABC transporter substrate-binding protein [Actinomyces slackii]|uniref:ABC-type taurine transport system, periplasmic component n=1 Tax=Actinomyces slackii TaxID=52774 RepID=A0A3S4UPH0_9ACTO|nr:ABC transporter substrate-binding protein [Actinomyces slackii]VEG75267.1 ABC-type taurine transport system, periplasmic component [Actinomyces slackii]
MTTAVSASRPSLSGTSRRSLLAGALLTLGAGALSACSSGTASRAASASGTGQGLTIGLTYTPNIQFAPFYLAKDKGHYASGVALRHHGAQEGLFDALATGAEHMVIAGADEAAVAASNGSELVIIAGFYQQYPVRIIVPESSPITAPADLKGRSVGLPGRMGENWYGLQLAMAGAGLSEADLTIQEVGFTQQSALVTGAVDAVIGFSNNDAVQIAQSGTPVRTIAVADDVPLIGASLVTTRSVLGARRQELTEAVAASIKGMTAFADDPDSAVESTKAHVPDLVDATQAANAREVAVATGTLIRPEADSVVGALAVDQVTRMLDFLAERGLMGGAAVSADALADPLSA